MQEIQVSLIVFLLLDLVINFEVLLVGMVVLIGGQAISLTVWHKWESFWHKSSVQQSNKAPPLQHLQHSNSQVTQTFKQRNAARDSQRCTVHAPAMQSEMTRPKSQYRVKCFDVITTALGQGELSVLHVISFPIFPYWKLSILAKPLCEFTSLVMKTSSVITAN